MFYRKHVASSIVGLELNLIIIFCLKYERNFFSAMFYRKHVSFSFAFMEFNIPICLNHSLFCNFLSAK